MKKIIVVCLVLFAINLGCKKSFVEPLCACSPVQYPSFNLALKNAAGADLLDPATANSFSKDKIQLFQKDDAGTIKQISFQLRPPFEFDGTKFSYFQLVSAEILSLKLTTNVSFFLKLGDAEPLSLKVDLNAEKNKIEKLTVDNKEAQKELVGLNKFPAPIFYFTL